MISQSKFFDVHVSNVAQNYNVASNWLPNIQTTSINKRCLVSLKSNWQTGKFEG